MKQMINVGKRCLELSNLDKVFWPAERYTKAELLEYYARVSAVLLEHLRDRPMVMQRFPDGITGKSFYQKQCPDHAPEWLRTVPIPSGSRQIDYCLLDDQAGLLWMVNQGCVEMHPWLSRYQHPDQPDFLVIDLDPSPPVGFREAVTVAMLVREVLAAFGVRGYPKTSGATGIHIYVPIANQYNYAQVRAAAIQVAGLVVRACPDLASIERPVAARRGKVYVDCWQNARGKTIASVYSVRPHPSAPVSAPVSWDELAGMEQPMALNMRNLPERLERFGDQFISVLREKENIDGLLHARRPGRTTS